MVIEFLAAYWSRVLEKHLPGKHSQRSHAGARGGGGGGLVSAKVESWPHKDFYGGNDPVQPTGEVTLRSYIGRTRALTWGDPQGYKERGSAEKDRGTVESAMRDAGRIKNDAVDLPTVVQAKKNRFFIVAAWNAREHEEAQTR